MEKYSFLKFIKIKEKNIKKKIKLLEDQIGRGETVDIKTIQFELLKLKKTLESINSRKTDTLIDPYDKLKDLIDNINASVKKIDSDVKSISDETSEAKKQEILNKIKEIEIVLDSDPSDYTKIIAKSKLSYVGEAINPEQIDAILKKYVADSQEIIDDIKRQIGGEDGKLLKNEQFKTIIDTIESKMSEYKISVGKFLTLKTDLEKYIAEMESVYTEIEIDTATEPVFPGDEAIIINVDTIDEKPEKELNPDDPMFKVAEDKEEIDQLIDTQFLHSKPKTEPSREDVDRKYLKHNNKYFSGFEKDKIIKTKENVDENMINLHSEWLKTLKEHVKDLETKSTKLDIISKNKSKLLGIQKILNDEIISKKVINENTDLVELNNDIQSKLEYYSNAEKPEELSKETEIESIPNNYGIDKLSAIKTFIQTYFSTNRLESEYKIKMKIYNLYDSIKSTINGPILTPADILSKIGTLLDSKKKSVSTLPQPIKNTFNEINYIYQLLQINKLLTDIIAKNSIDKKYISIMCGGADKGDDSGLSESEEATLQDLIVKLSEYEKLVRDIKDLNNSLNRIIKRYNIRYSQFFNFQKYIVNYVSIKVAKGGYSYYQYMSKGTISFFDTLLTNLTNILDKYNKFSNLSENDYKILSQDDKKWFYGKHYFMIKILQSFFNKLYLYWDAQEKVPEIKDKWELKNQIKTDSPTNNNKYFFLFNIFQDILMEYHMTLPSIANYIRINKIGDEAFLETFKKGSKNTLSKENLEKCTQEDSHKNADYISQIKFEEVFDPDNFKENDNLSLYMGLSAFINKGKSIMILTYGYSGVGKSYTLFGGHGKSGMLQSTLNTLGSGVEIGVKMFELYGLGVPYKFYWENPDLFCHLIYHYQFDTTNNINVSEKTKSNFREFLNLNNNYQSLTKSNIDAFGDYVSKIDSIRKETGRIKATLNNPESSRSIMIYDFRIKLKKPIKNGDTVKEYANFVVMDLPGKENLYQTYCDSLDPSFEINDNFKKHKKVPIVTKTSRGETTTQLQETQTSDEYDNKLLRAMMYINPLWLSMIPEIAEHFDLTGNNSKHLDIDKINISIPVHMLLTTGFSNEEKCSNAVNVESNVENYKKIMTTRGLSTDKVALTKCSSNNKDVFVDVFNKVDNSILHHQYQYFKKNKISELSFVESKYLGLMGMTERSLHNIVNMIKTGDLFKLGSKLNDMLKDPVKKEQKYGYAGLEGIYINENILGLLQVLANRVVQIKKGPDASIDVVCSQQEIYKNTSTTGTREKFIPLGDATRREGENVYFLQDDEFYSQVDFLNAFQHINYEKSKVSETFSNDIYYNIFRNSDLPDYKSKPINEWITGYDYNKIFNIKNPPIKDILGPYLDSIDNFYLFFVVSNNKKKKGDDRVETCDKQMKLLYDTRKFMEVVAEDDPRSIMCPI